MKPRISAIIHTLNEEKNVGNALRSVAHWVDEIVVVDMHSADRTVEIAESFGARVFYFEPVGYMEPARGFAEEQATGDWILVLDADEIIPPRLAERLREIANQNSVDICYLPRLNYFAGFPLRHTGWGPEQDRIPRFYKKQTFVHLPTIHTFPVAKQGATSINLPADCFIIHFNYLSVSHVLTKLNRYTSVEANQSHAASTRPDLRQFLLRPLIEFINRYIRRGGFKDGWPGFYYSVLMSFYRLTQAMKLREMYLVGSEEDVRARYQEVADRALASETSAPMGRPE